jgi:hypothetical protein
VLTAEIQSVADKMQTLGFLKKKFKVTGLILSR